jgi:hypothetical protein
MLPCEKNFVFTSYDFSQFRWPLQRRHYDVFVVSGWHQFPGNGTAAILYFSETQMNWKESTPEERIAFCDEHAKDLFGIRTAIEWDTMSPTTQLLLHLEGVSDKCIFEA